ncbi:MAG: Hsp70 family protein, partial [Actinobacteria bacterium]|nr:Hsp70 family protein [Actinomycetota bacterium]
SLQVAGLVCRVEVTRELFLERSRILLDEMTEKMVDVMAAAGLHPKDVGVVLAVGGSTRLPAVRKRIVDLFGIEPETSVRPDEAIALGAALFAAQRQLERGGALVMEAAARDYLERLRVNDVAAHTLGISVFDAGAGTGGQAVMAPVLPRNTALPFEAKRTFYTMRANETSIVVPVLEGEGTDPDVCRRIGTVTIQGLPPGRPQHQQVDVVMRLDRDGILEVSATDVASGAAATTTIVHTHEQGEDQAEADVAVRALVVE